MPDEEIDMNRYYLRPGCTEPELRPEFAAEEAAAMAPESAAPVKKKRAPRKEAKAKKK